MCRCGPITCKKSGWNTKIYGSAKLLQVGRVMLMYCDISSRMYHHFGYYLNNQYFIVESILSWEDIETLKNFHKWNIRPLE